MKIAMVSEHASPLATLGGVDSGGQNVHVAELARGLARRGAQVVVHTRRESSRQRRRVELEHGVAVDHIPAGPGRVIPKDELLPHMGAFSDHLRRAWERDRPDVVHAHFWMSGIASLPAANALGIPVVQTFHALGVVKRRYQGDKDTSAPQRIALERRLADGAARIIATCTDEAFELIRMGADSDRVTVIPCGVDLDLFTPNGPRERRGAARRLVCLARLVQRKGVGNVILALSRLPDTELVIAGGPARERLEDDPEARRLMELARREGVEDRVQLRGSVGRADVARLLRSADIAVCAPWYEPFGIVPLEAMACGVPVVASAVGGMIDTVVDEVTGAHVPPRDPERLAETLACLLADPDRRASYGRAGRERAETLYGWKRIVAQTSDVYADLAAQRTPRRRGGLGVPPVHVSARRNRHIGALAAGLLDLERKVGVLESWGASLACALTGGARLLAVGNGGSAAQAHHLTAELVGRYEDERRPLSALCLHADAASLTAITNDYGPRETFARQVRAHGRPGDVLLALSTSGRSENVLAAVVQASRIGLTTLALTGPGPNPLADACSQAVALEAPSTATVQELHLVALHLLCEAVDRALATDLPEHVDRGPGAEVPEPVVEEVRA